MKDQLIAVAKESLYGAGEILRQNFRKKHKVTYKKDSSKVTEIDYACNDFIVNRIKQDFPNHVIFTEESEFALEQVITKDPTWVIDPLDGTSNFISGIPIFGTMLCFIENEEPVMSAIYDPIHDLFYFAYKGDGATVNGVPTKVSETLVTRGAMMFAGRGYKQFERKRHSEIIMALEQETTYFRRLGSAAIMLASVTDAQADAVILTCGRLWDILPGAFLIQEAGGTVTDFNGNPWNVHSHDLVGSNGKIHDQLIAITHPLVNAYDSHCTHQDTCSDE